MGFNRRKRKPSPNEQNRKQKSEEQMGQEDSVRMLASNQEADKIYKVNCILIQAATSLYIFDNHVTQGC